jgi:hypothetical protein
MRSWFVGCLLADRLPESERFNCSEREAHHVWRSVPVHFLTLWERLVERVAGWTRMGVVTRSGEWNSRYWDRGVRRS